MSSQDPQPPPQQPSAPPPQYTNYPRHGGQPAGPSTAPTFGGLIPNNPDSLWSYYLGLAAVIPCIALVTGPIAMIRGRRALAYCKTYPSAGGKTHAYVGIGCGTVMLLVNIAAIAFVVLLIENNGRI